MAKMLDLPKVMQVIDDSYNYHYAIVLGGNRTQKGSGIETYNGYIFIKSGELGNTKYRNLRFLGSEFKPALFTSKRKETYSRYSVYLPPHCITAIFNVQLQLRHDVRDDDLIEELENFIKYYKMGKVKPADLKIQDKHLFNEYVEWQSLKSAIESSKCFGCEQREVHVQSIHDDAKIKKDLAHIEKQIKECEIVFGFEDTEKMLRVLRELNFINENNIPQLKTRVARELGGGVENLYITELLMKNVLDKLEPEEIVPVISVFVAQGRSRDEFNLEDLDVPDSLMVALKQCQDIFDLIKGAEQKQEIKSDIEPNYLLVKTLHEWAKGSDFVDITEHTDVLEGAIVRTIQRVEQTLRSIKRGLTVIGNDTQMEKVEKATVIIKRDIAFALSLYIDENKEILA